MIIIRKEHRALTHHREALPGSLTEYGGPAGCEHLSLCVHSSGILNVAAAGTLPVDVDSVFFNLCPVWGFLLLFFCGAKGGRGDWMAVEPEPFRISCQL